jgi:N4-gp56 family major capsid protein
MAVTSFATGDSLAVKLWSKKMAVEALKQTWVYKFLGRDANSVIQVFDDTSKSEGDRIRIPLRRLLVGAGVLGDATLEGNEERLNYYSDDIFINQLRHAVREGGKFTRQLVPFDIRENARQSLQDWFADRIDTWFFNQICANTFQTDVRYTGMQSAIAADSQHIVFPAGTTTTGSLSNSATMLFTLTLIDVCVEKAKTLEVPIRPIMMNGEEKYVMFLHPSQVTDMRTTTATGQWLDITKAALQGGNITKNPIYTGALGEYNGVILHASPRVPLAISATVQVASTRVAAFCGAQACAMAFGRGTSPEKFDWVEDFFDYDNQFGVAAGTIAGLKKLVFNGSDFATIICPTYAALHTSA